MKQVGPELGFGQHEHERLESIEIGADGPGQVERAIEDAIRFESFAGQRLTGACCCGDDDQIAGQRRFKRPDQARDGENFADRDSVKPDERALVRK